MKWLAALQLIPLITNLVKIAEGMMGAGTGVKKKAFVVDGIEQIINAMEGVSSGGQKETWGALLVIIEPIKALVDSIASLMFPHKR
jgi:hypothetical protein